MLSRILGDPSGLRTTAASTPVPEEVDMNDPFVGTWTLNPTRSAFDPNHKPSEATMTWQLETDGTYVLLAKGVAARGTPCGEKPQRLRPDGAAYSVDGFPGLMSVTTRANRTTIRAE